MPPENEETPDIIDNMNKRFLSIPVIAIISVGLLTGCTNMPSDSKPTSSPNSSTSLTNPIEKENTLLTTVNFENGLTVNIYQEATGYPSEKQLIFFKEQLELNQAKTSEKSTTTPEPKTTDKSSALNSKRRVIAIRYEVVNNSSEPINIRSFNPLLGFFPEETKDAPIGQADYSDESLHSSIGLPSYPSNFAPDAPEWILEPGVTANWNLDWLVPDDLNLVDKNKIILIQNLNLNELWISEIKLSLENNSSTKKDK